MSSRSVALHTLGCRLNQCETEALASDLRRRKYSIVDFDDNADVYILNTCTVTAQADRKSRNLMNRARGHEKSLVIVTGCYVDHHKAKLQSEALIYFIENNKKSSIPDLVDAHFHGEVLHPDSLDTHLFSYIPGERILRTRSLVKIQDGCDNYCSFCIIPFVRGRAQSRPLADVLEDVRQSVASGSKEIILTGVNMSRYDDEGRDFTTLLQSILNLDGNFRLRISSLEPERLDDRFTELLEHPKFCPHLHLCLQSGSEKILLKMRRMYTVQQFRDVVETIRKRDEHFNISTDIIAGFPGETDKDFAESCNIARELCFSHIHTFPYSPRTMTRALRMDDQLPPPVIKERCEILRDISTTNTRRYREQFIEKYEEILIEQDKRTRGGSYGLGRYYLPIEVPDTVEINSFQRVKIMQMPEGDDPILQATIA